MFLDSVMLQLTNVLHYLAYVKHSGFLVTFLLCELLFVMYKGYYYNIVCQYVPLGLAVCVVLCYLYLSAPVQHWCHLATLTLTPTPTLDPFLTLKKKCHYLAN